MSPSPLTAFAARLSDGRAGLCGATVVGFESPHPVQAFGGARLHPLLLIGGNIGEGARYADAPDRARVPGEHQQRDHPPARALGVVLASSIT